MGLRYADRVFPRLHAEIMKDLWKPVPDELDESGNVPGPPEFDHVERLLRCGADPNRKGLGGMRPLHLAAGHPCEDTVELLLERGAKPNRRDACGRTALHYAARRRNSSSDRMWPNRPADGISPEAMEAVGRELEAARVAELLTGVGANPDVRDNYGMAPLHYAAKFDNGEMVEALARAGADMDRIGDGSQTPLHLAACVGSVCAARALLAAGADPGIPNCEGAPALHYAASNGDAGMAAALIEGGADPLAENIVRETALFCAVGDECRRIIGEAQERARAAA